MILEVDMGNSRVKWRVVGSQVEPSLFALSNDEPFERVFEALRTDVEAVRVASVVPGRNRLLWQWCLDSLGVEPEFAQVSAFEAGVSNGYAEPQQMGVDRWLAILAAYERVHSACLVVDCGSACTVDLVASDGCHLGGYIVPGLGLMRRALFRDTGQVQAAELPYVLPAHAGRSTDAAVAAGLPLMLQGLVELGYEELYQHSAQPPSIVLCGGDGELLGRILGEKMAGAVVYVEGLVLDGLQLAQRFPLLSPG